MKRFLWVPWRWWRRIAQLALLVLFVWLFRRTESTGADTLPGGENLFFRLDPLAGAAAMIAGRRVLSAFWPALVVLLLTLALGRFFCGWICPLGTLLDLFQRAIRPLARLTARWTGGGFLRRAQVARYVLLLACLFGAAFAFPLVGLADPFALLYRGLTFWADPRFFSASDAVLTWTGRESTDPVRLFFVRHLLPFRAGLFDLAGASAALLAAIFALELAARRFWCRGLCPLGALLGLVGRFSFVRRLPARVCNDCGKCAANCRMGALAAPAGISPESCNLCMDCVDDCPRSIVKFAVPRPKPALAPLDVSRRGFLAAAVAGAAVPVIARHTALAAGPLDPYFLRPPGVGSEERFLNLCIRCGLCMKACPTNVLQPALLQSGLEGMFTPRLAPRAIFELGYCEYNCNLCGQVCPSGAIPPLPLEQKQKAFVGKAYFDHRLCLPWAKKEACIRCEEVCPLPEKAIKIQNTFNVTDNTGQEIEIQQPFVERYLCTGCGMCEAVCPLPDAPAIRVLRVEAPDPQTEFLTGE